MSKKVRFSVPSILVLLPNTNSKWAGAGWYSQDEMESFKALFELSVAEVRMKLSRGGIDAIASTGRNTFGTFWGGSGTENTPDVFRHDNFEQFFEQLSTPPSG